MRKGHRKTGAGACDPHACVCGDHVFRPITKGHAVLVSPEDAFHLEYSWQATVDKRGYVAVTRKKTIATRTQKTVVLAREILNLPDGVLADHKSGNTLDNRRGNIRPGTRSQNAQNGKLHADCKVPFKGVYIWRGKFRAHIKHEGKRVELGMFDTAEGAHRAYLAAAERLFGEFARAA